MHIRLWTERNSKELRTEYRCVVRPEGGQELALGYYDKGDATASFVLEVFAKALRQEEL